MRDQISRFMLECPEARKQTFANNPYGDFVRKDIPETFYNTGLVNREEYQIKGSVGDKELVELDLDRKSVV